MNRKMSETELFCETVLMLVQDVLDADDTSDEDRVYHSVKKTVEDKRILVLGTEIDLL